jgi:hypothetical protein
MATAVVFDDFVKNVGLKLINLDTDTIKAVLSSVAPNAETMDQLADITQITAGTTNYAAVECANPTWAETGAGTGVWQFSCDAFAWTAGGTGDYPSARYVTIYSDTASGDELICFIDYGAAFTLTNGNTLTVTPGANGLVRFTVT